MELAYVTVSVDHFAAEPSAFASLSPSAARVLQAILDDGPTTLPELAQRTGLARRTIAYAISRLKEERLIAWHARLDDFRYRYFFVHPRLVGHDAEDVIRLDGGGQPPSAHLVDLFAR